MASIMKGSPVDTKMDKSFWALNNDLQNYCRTWHNEGTSFFYCNNPETLEPGDLADDGKFLTRNGVLGEGMVYTWHRNMTDKTIHSIILIHNPDIEPIQVTVTNIGLTNTSWGNDRNAWESYYNGGRNESVRVVPGGYASILVQDNVANGNYFGKIAKFNIVYEGTNIPGYAYFYDLAYYRDSSSAHDFAIGDKPVELGKINSRRRGVGNWYLNKLTVTQIKLTEEQPTRAVSIGGIYAQTDNFMDSFFGDDMVEIVGGSGRKDEHDTGYLYGSYGLPINMEFTIKNDTRQNKEIRIFMGCESTDVPVFARYNGEFFRTAADKEFLEKTYIRDVITLGTIAAGNSVSITFDTANLAMSAGAFFIGARLV